MAKKIYSFWNLLLGSLITLLGFGSCKTSKNVPPEDDTLKLYGPPPPEIIEKPTPIEPIQVLYGAPPVRKERLPEVKFVK